MVFVSPHLRVAVLFLLGVLFFASGVENFSWTTTTTTTSRLDILHDGCSAAADSSEQRHLVAQQLGGWLPSNFVRVAAVCQDGSPLVIQTYPLAGGSPRRQARSAAGGTTTKLNPTQNQQQQQQPSRQEQLTPFPTLYWLCHPQVNKCVAELERRGCAAEFQKVLDDHAPLRNEWLQSHRQYAQERWNVLTIDDQRWLLAAADANNAASGRWSAAQSKLAILRDSGISGCNLTTTPSVKCLHAHYAHYRASLALLLRSDELRLLNPIGAMVHERLRVEFPELEL